MDSFAVLLACLGILVSHQYALGAPDNRGTEFVIGFMDNYLSDYKLELFVTTSRTTNVNVRVRCPRYGNLDKSFTVTAGKVEQTNIDVHYRVEGSKIESKGILVTADDEVVVYGVNKQKYSNDAFLGLPTDVLGTEYYAITYYPPYRRAQIMVVGVEDSTTVNIKFPSSSWARTTDSFYGRSYAKGSTLKLNLNRFDTFQIQSAGDLTGAYITSDKPISVFSGNRKTNTGQYGSQDHLVEHLTPVNTWGKKFATVPIPKRSFGDYFKVIASEDSTSIKYKCKKSNSYSSYSINLSKAGDFKQVTVSSGKYCYWEADKAILLNQIVLSQKDNNEPADPALLIIPPIEQYAADYTFTTPKYSGGSYDNYFLFVVKNNERTKLKIDGAAFPSNTAYTEIPDTEYVGGYINVNDGSHTVRHDSPISVFGGFLYGRARLESYGFTTGMRLAGVNQVCIPSPTVVGDGIDNDCDGLIDEELCTVENRGKDDDGDGQAEEDCATPPPIDGIWAAWQSWGSCSQSCSPSGRTVSGTQTRIRTCTNPAPKYDGKQCSGDSSLAKSCTSSTYCPINGGWSSWSSWGACSVTCASGTVSRSRSCNQPSPQYGGASCSGDSIETKACTKSACPIDGGWSAWTSWGSCSLNCGGGSQSKSRTCNNPSPQYGGKSCSGSATDSQSCNTHSCAIDGGWSNWASWGTCSHTCGGGSQSKSRSCTNPAPQFGGKSCSGSDADSQSCNTNSCPIDGGWSNWAAWGTCSLTCGGGSQSKSRSCTNPSPRYGGKSCSGSTTASQSCNTHNCPIDGSWNAWTSWGSCSLTCGGGSQTKTRTCTSPSPQYGGKSCSGSATASQSCGTISCPIDGGWTDWTSWGSCSLTCGGGSQSKSRSCTNPAPQHGGSSCSGSTTASQSCNTLNCPIDGGWSSWTSWGTCSLTCGGGSQSKSRTCTNPSPQYNGKSCSGSSTASQSCNSHNCPIDGGWTDWTSWGSCSLTCGGGSQSKSRSCTNPSPQYGGSSCSGSTTASQSCNTHNCPIDGGWTVWTSWATCSLTCGGGSQSKSRACTNPSPQYGGSFCSGSDGASQSCNTHHCPIDGGWSLWSSYSSCTVSCGGGTHYKTRVCDNPTTQYGGQYCSGTSLEMKACNTQNCPIDGGWNDWTSWGTCSLTCGGGSQSKSRTCTNPSPQYGGASCSGSTTAAQSCNTQNCPIDGAWTDWAQWGSCTVTCGGGTQLRDRTCTNPSPQYGGASCSGSGSDSTSCNTQVCIIDGAWGAWSSWGTCSVTCGGGSYLRSRVCDDPRPANGGLPCSGSSGDSDSCNTNPCPTAAAGAYFQLCPTGWFTCNNGSMTCINMAFKCDCDADCDDGSDETVSYAGCLPQLVEACQNSAYGFAPAVVFMNILCLLAIVLIYRIG